MRGHEAGFAVPQRRAPARPLLEVTDLASWFTTPRGTIRAVDGVSLTLEAGRSLGVVGESGSGKTQTFYGILGLTRGAPGLVRGAARIGDVELLHGLSDHVTVTMSDDGTPAVRKQTRAWQDRHQQHLAPLLGRDVSILFQDPRRSLIPYWTVGRHLKEVIERRTGATTGMSRFFGASRKAWMEEGTQLLRDLGFRDPARILSSYPERLSGGEAQRAMLALTMAMRPQLLIADEPTTGLDTINQARVLATLAHLHETSRMSLVLISHDLAVVDAMVQDVVVMYGGRIMASAPTSVLRNQPDEALHPYALEMRESHARRASAKRLSAQPVGDPATRAHTGCPFQHRCALRPRLSAAVRARCANEVPTLETRADSMSVACWGVNE